MTFLVNVLYPQGDFNLDYYLKTHMPLVESTWASKGLKDWKVAKLGPGADGSEVCYATLFSLIRGHYDPDANANTKSQSPYQIQAILTFDTAEQFGAAATEDGAKIFGDIPNFTSTTATILSGETVGSKS
jgi:hypothetical protein